MSRAHLSLVAVLLLVAGCGGTRTPLAPPPPEDVVHGVLYAPSQGATGIQGINNPWLRADDEIGYDLELGPGVEPLSDPSNSGRGVVITGRVAVRDLVPAGALERVLRVTSFTFD